MGLRSYGVKPNALLQSKKRTHKLNVDGKI